MTDNANTMAYQELCLVPCDDRQSGTEPQQAGLAVPDGMPRPCAAHRKPTSSWLHRSGELSGAAGRAAYREDRLPIHSLGTRVADTGLSGWASWGRLG